jgi:hypothetical protein
VEPWEIVEKMESEPQRGDTVLTTPGNLGAQSK